MPPFFHSSPIVDLGVSSLELDASSTTLKALNKKAQLTNLLKRDDVYGMLSPTEFYHQLTARDGGSVKAPDHAGAVDPTNINMKGIQALIAIIGAGFVVGIVWFFFWAKNGGFQWRKGDWDDYKSTVLRRKGPNGTTLSNATKSTRLGDGSVVGEGYSDGSVGTNQDTMTETWTDMGSEAPINERAKRESAKEKKIREVKEAQWEGGHDEDMRAYIHEKPARVGGINKDSDAFHYGTDYTDTEGSAIHSNTNRSSRNVGPRASSSRQASPEKRQARRDFSFGNDEAFSTVSSSQPEMPAAHYAEPVAYAEVAPPTPLHRPGRYHSPSKQFNQPESRRSPHPLPNVPGGYQESSVISDVQSQNTRTYHHPLPSLTNQNQNQGGQTRGYRRDRRDSFDD